MLGALNVATKILAARLAVLLAIVGALILAYPMVGQANPYQLGMLACYCVGVVFPAVWLASRG